MLEKGRLYSLRKDGTKDSLYLNIKNKRFLFGSSEYCTVRIYIDGIFPEHCVLSIGGQGRAYLEPLHPLALTLVNGIKIKHKVYLQDNDVITIFIKEFQFAYPYNSLSRNVFFERPILPYSKQMKPAQKVEMLAPGKSWETSQPVRESIVSKTNYIPKKQICIISGDIIKKISEFSLKFALQEPVNIAYEKINDHEVNSCFDKFLIKCNNQYFKESPGVRRNLALKLYRFIKFLKVLLNRNGEHLYVLWPILESVWKYCIARASEDILFSPIKSLNLKGEVTVYKKAFQSRILSCTSKNLSPVSNIMSEKESQCINSLKVKVLSDGKMDGQKQNQYSSRKISISYKKRVSLAVKRYHLRKRKSTMVAKAVEALELPVERPQTKESCREITSGEQDVVIYTEKQKTTGRKRKRLYNKKEVLTDIEPGKENISEITDNSSGNQVTIFNLREQKQSKEKENSKNKGLKQESIEHSSGEQNTNTKLTKTKATKRSYKRKKKEAVTNKTALKEEMEKKLTHDSPKKTNIISETNDIKSKKRNHEKKKEVSLEKTGKSTQECDTLESSRCQRITRSMAKSRH